VLEDSENCDGAHWNGQTKQEKLSGNAGCMPSYLENEQ
jgi:hypothetical protein